MCNKLCIGFFVPSSGSSRQYICPDDTFSVEASSDCSPCIFGLMLPPHAAGCGIYVNEEHVSRQPVHNPRAPSATEFFLSIGYFSLPLAPLVLFNPVSHTISQKSLNQYSMMSSHASMPMSYEYSMSHLLSSQQSMMSSHSSTPMSYEQSMSHLLSSQQSMMSSQASMAMSYEQSMSQQSLNQYSRMSSQASMPMSYEQSMSQKSSTQYSLMSSHTSTPMSYQQSMSHQS